MSLTEKPAPALDDAQVAEAGEEGGDEAAEEPASADPLEEFRESLRSKPGDWFVVHTYSGMENRVKANLESRITSLNMEDYIHEVVVPTEEVAEIKNGQRRMVKRTVLPGYVLVQIATHEEAGIPRMDNESWHLVKETPKVMGFIGGTADRPLPIADREADAILQRVQEGVEKPKPKVLFEPGEMVRVIDGPFNDFNGVVEEINYEKSRLRVAVLIFGRSTPVEMEFGQVEKA